MIVETDLSPCAGRGSRRLESPGLLKVLFGLIYSDVGRVMLYIYRHASCRCSSGLEAGAGVGCAGVSAVWGVAV